jgi:hypothetical protein
MMSYETGSKSPRHGRADSLVIAGSAVHFVLIAIYVV